VFALTGEIYDVVVDIRRGSPTFGKWFGTRLAAREHPRLFVPRGFADGLCVLSERADVIYKCTEVYAPKDEYGIPWADPEIGIDWPMTDPILSPKDAALPRLAQVPPSRLPVY
jgi:dTDP-4-dehydrorhamnose 3,5-epimerase